MPNRLLFKLRRFLVPSLTLAWACMAAVASAGQELVPGTPALPDPLLWPGVVVIIVIAAFATAALAGPVIRVNTQDEIAESGSDDSQPPQ